MEEHLRQRIIVGRAELIKKTERKPVWLEQSKKMEDSKRSNKK